MGRQPYLYQPVTHAPFNPKAYTQSLANPAPPRRPKSDGPLITFNRHPDSYDNLPYGKHVGAKMMSPGSKKRILWARKMQLAWRVLQWIVALGVLVCVALMKGIPDTQGWILRLPPAFDLAVTAYAIWHLCRSANHHPPASSASYHAFALLMDIGFIAFYVFNGVLTKTQFAMVFGESGRWRTVLPDEQATNTILQVGWLVALVNAGLHGISLFIDGYLIYMFRKIADLPPDMNPLEDNLTSRSKSKHKYKNSDLSTLIGSDKRLSEISARDSNRTLNNDEDPLRMSQMSEKLMGVDNRSSGVSFFQSRDGHAHAYSPHNPDTARQSWHVSNPSIYQQQDPSNQSIYSTHTNSPSPKKARASRADLDEPLPPRYGKSRTMSPMPLRTPRITKRSSATPASPIPIYDDANSAEDANWEVLSGAGSLTDDGTSTHDFDPYRQQTKAQGSPAKNSSRGLFPPGTVNTTSRYEQVAQDDSDVRAGNVAVWDAANQDHSPSQPLRMNPPTPEPRSTSQQHVMAHSPLARLSRGYEDDKENGAFEQDYERSQTLNSESQYSEPDTTVSSSVQGSGSNAQSKSRFYTDLAAAMRGVRHHQPVSKAPQSIAGSVHTHLSSSTATTNSHGRALPATQGDLRIKPTSGTVIRKPLKSFDEGVQTGYMIAKGSPSRVVSRTGVDVAEGDLGLASRRREVSGKVAEEGRGGGIWRRISGRVPSR